VYVRVRSWGCGSLTVYAATIDAGQIYTDQTGRFPVVSSKGNKYIMILYDYDSNAIFGKTNHGSNSN
jgi:hypothetical protein